MRLRSIFALFTGLALLIAGQLQAATEIPFRFRDGMVWVKVAVPGRSAALNFLLDSGAGASVLHLPTARSLGAKLGAPEPVQGVHSRGIAYRVERFAGELGGIAVPQRMLALDLSAVSFGCHQQIDGLLGADFFRGRIVQIDYAAEKLRLLRPAEVSLAGCEALPLVRRGDALCTRVCVAGKAPTWMRVDTGCNSALQWVVKDGGARKARGTSIGVATSTRRHLVTDVQLGNVRLEGIQAGIHARPIFAGEAGLLGNGVLARFTVTFDAPGKRLLLARR